MALGGNTSADDRLRRARCDAFVKMHGYDARVARVVERIKALPGCVDTSDIEIAMRKLAESRNELAIFRASADSRGHQRLTDLHDDVRSRFIKVNYGLGLLEAGANGKIDNMRGIVVVTGAVGPIDGFYHREVDGARRVLFRQ